MAVAALKAAASGRLFLVILGGVVLVFILVLILPINHSLKKQDEEIQDLEQKLKDQAMLQPLYLGLTAKARFDKPDGLPVPDPAPLPRADLGKLTELFSAPARDAGLTFVKVQPDINSLREGHGLLLTEVTLLGDFPRLQKYFLGLGRLPFLNHVERVDVRRTKDGDEIGLRLWLALE
jgi:hypothetical protein